MASMPGEERRVGGEVDTIGFAEARSALAWWLEAGVDIAVQEEPRDWLKPSPSRARAAAPVETAPPPNIAAPSHDTLTELQSWLASSMRRPRAAPAAGRGGPRGAAEAA